MWVVERRPYILHRGWGEWIVETIHRTRYDARYWKAHNTKRSPAYRIRKYIPADQKGER